MPSYSDFSLKTRTAGVNLGRPLSPRDAQGLTATERRCAEAECRYGNPNPLDPRRWNSTSKVETVAEIAGVSRSTVQRTRRKLRALGWTFDERFRCNRQTTSVASPPLGWKRLSDAPIDAGTLELEDGTLGSSVASQLNPPACAETLVGDCDSSPKVVPEERLVSERWWIERQRASVHRRRLLGVLAECFGRCSSRREWGRRSKAVAELVDGRVSAEELGIAIVGMGLEQRSRGGTFTEMAVVANVGRLLHLHRKRRDSIAAVFAMAGRTPVERSA